MKQTFPDCVCWCICSVDKPVFAVSSMTSYTVSVLEHQPVTINLTAMANPSNVTYRWYRTTAPHRLTTEPHSQMMLRDELITTSAGALLTFNSVSRHDAGVLTCIASNSEGSTTLTVIIDVLCMISTFTLQLLFIVSLKRYTLSAIKRATLFCAITSVFFDEF